MGDKMVKSLWQMSIM